MIRALIEIGWLGGPGRLTVLGVQRAAVPGRSELADEPAQERQDR